MKKFTIKIREVIKRILFTLIMVLSYANSAYASSVGAGDLENTKLFTGTKNLLTTGTAILTGLATAVTIFFAVVNALAWQTAADQEKPAAKKKLISTVIAGVITITIGGVITAVFAFYN